MSTIVSRWINRAQRFDVQAYKPPRDPRSLKDTHVAYSGALFKHPHDDTLALLVTDPGGGNATWLEFRVNDISFVESLPNIAGPDGDVVFMVRIWVKKMSVGIRHTPFLVEDMSFREG